MHYSNVKFGIFTDLHLDIMQMPMFRKEYSYKS